jgi:hypothetical protein
MTINGYLGGNLVGSTNAFNLTVALASTPGPAWGTFSGIDKVEFVSDGGGRWWVMDNVTYNGQVPDGGATATLLGSALLGLGLLRRKLRG